VKQRPAPRRRVGELLDVYAEDGMSLDSSWRSPDERQARPEKSEENATALVPSGADPIRRMLTEKEPFVHSTKRALFGRSRRVWL